MTKKTPIILSAFLLIITSSLLGQTKKEKWVTYKDGTYPFSFVYPETIIEKNAKGKYKTVFQGWDKEPEIIEKSEGHPTATKYVVVGGIGGDYYLADNLSDLWTDSFRGFAAVIFESSSALKLALDKEIKEAKKEEACRVNGYTIRKSSVTIKGGIKATEYFFCHPHWEAGGDESYTWLEAIIWRIPKGLPESVALITHYEIPIKKRAAFIWKILKEDEGSKWFVEKTPQDKLKLYEDIRRYTLKTLNSFEWQKKK